MLYFLQHPTFKSYLSMTHLPTPDPTIPTYTPGSINLLLTARTTQNFKFTTKPLSPNHLTLTSLQTCFYRHLPYTGPNPKPITVVYCHGGSSDCYSDPDLEAWASKNHLGYFACDLITYGKSSGYDPTEQNFLISDHATQTIEVTSFASENFFPGHKILLTGASFGGQMCFLAIRDREFRKRIHGVLTLGAACNMQSECAELYKKKGGLTGEQKRKLHLNGKIKKKVDGEVMHFNRDYVRDCIENCSFGAENQEVLECDFPVTILHGSDDDVIEVWVADEVEGKIRSPKLKKVIVEGGDHYFGSEEEMRITYIEYDEMLRYIEAPGSKK